MKVEVISNFKPIQTTFTETQIVAAIKKQKADTTVKEVCRELGISEPHFLQIESPVRQPGSIRREVRKELEAERAQYKKMYAELSLDH